MLSVFQLGRFESPFKIAGTRVIGGFRILRRSAQCTRRPNLKAARKKERIDQIVQTTCTKFRRMSSKPLEVGLLMLLPKDLQVVNC